MAKKRIYKPIPSPVNLRGRAYAINSVENLMEESECVGRCNSNLHSIEIESHVFNGQHTADTIVHEILHAMVAESGLRAVKKWDEEMVVSMLSPVLIGFLTDNPEIIKYVVSMNKRGLDDASE